MLGREASYAGTSFVPASGIGSLRFGSERVSVTADATSAGGLGSYRWDDEGVEGRAVPIVREGVLTGFLSSRETAAEIGLERSGGCMRAEGFDRQPIVRMTNVNLEPGDAGTLDDLIADTDQGLLIETNRSWSIDNRRLQFQFEGEAAWEIRGGERGRLLRNRASGGDPEPWGRCDAVCSAGDGGWSRCSIAARASRARWRASPTVRHRPASGTSRSALRDVSDLAERAAGLAGPDALAADPRALAHIALCRESADAVDGRRRRDGWRSPRSTAGGSAGRLPTPSTRMLLAASCGGPGRRSRGRRDRRGLPRLEPDARPAAPAEPARPDPATAELAPGPGAPSSRPRSRAPGRRASRHTGSGPRARCGAWAMDAGAGAESTTDAFMKVICLAPGGRSGYAAHTARASAELDEPARSEEEAAAQSTPPATRPSCHPATTRSSSRRTQWAACSSCWRGPHSTASPTPMVGAR